MHRKMYVRNQNENREEIMFCYRGVWYNPEDLNKKQAKKSQKTQERVYRGTKHAA